MMDTAWQLQKHRGEMLAYAEQLKAAADIVHDEYANKSMAELRAMESTAAHEVKMKAVALYVQNAGKFIDYAR